MHITQRGNNRTPTFLDEYDFAHYRELLRVASKSAGCTIHAYALMTNHVHLLVTPSTTTSSSRMMQILGRLYVRYFNTRSRRTGTLWEGRFRSALIDSSSYYLACSRYIDLNPVRAGMVTSPGDYEWSSFAKLGLGTPDPLVTFHPEYLALARTAPDRCRAYTALCTVDDASNAHSAIRQATKGGSALGSDEFHQRMAQSLRRRVVRLPTVGYPRGLVK